MALDNRDQRAYIAVSALAGTDLITVKRTIRKVFKKEAFGDRWIAKLYNEFRNAQRLTTDVCPRSGRPVTSTDENHEEVLNELMSQSRTWTIDEIVDVMGISKGSVWNLLQRGHYRKIGARWLPHALDQQDMELRVRACRLNLRWFTNEPRMLGRIIAIDETWIRAYTPLDPQNAREWRLPGEEV